LIGSLSIAAVALLLGSLGATNDDYPHRPANAHLAFEQGRLTIYTLGNHGGGLTIMRSNGKRDDFFIAYPNKINGKHYLCAELPSIHNSPDDVSCNQRPPNVVVGKTSVRVTYWWGTMYGKPAKISDEITTLGS